MPSGWVTNRTISNSSRISGLRVTTVPRLRWVVSRTNRLETNSMSRPLPKRRTRCILIFPTPVSYTFTRAIVSSLDLRTIRPVVTKTVSMVVSDVRPRRHLGSYRC